jgi:hypothetical protein
MGGWLHGLRRLWVIEAHQALNIPLPVNIKIMFEYVRNYNILCCCVWLVFLFWFSTTTTRTNPDETWRLVLSRRLVLYVSDGIVVCFVGWVGV